MNHQEATCSANRLRLDLADPAVSFEDPRVVQALEEYITALETGHPPDRQEFLTSHPAIAAVLAACLDGLKFVHAVAPRLSQALPDAAGAPPSGTPNLGLGTPL